MLPWVFALQPTSAMTIEPDMPVVVTLDGRGAIDVHYSSEGSETVFITAKALGADNDDPIPPLDTVLEVVSPSGARLDYNDDYFPALLSDEIISELGLQPTDSAITALTLDEAGAYHLRVNSFNGVSTGEVELLIQRVDRVQIDIQPTEDTAFSASVTLRPNQVAQIEISLEAERSYTITARDPSGVLDAVLQVSDEAGNLLAANDDHLLDDVTLNIFDSRISDFSPTETGNYVLTVRDYLGRSGVLWVEVDATDVD
jgi:hypothetical protein